MMWTPSRKSAGRVRRWRNATSTTVTPNHAAIHTGARSFHAAAQTSANEITTCPGSVTISRHRDSRRLPGRVVERHEGLEDGRRPARPAGERRQVVRRPLVEPRQRARRHESRERNERDRRQR